MHASPCPASFFKGVAPQGELSPIFRGEVSMPCAFLKGGGPPRENARNIFPRKNYEASQIIKCLRFDSPRHDFQNVADGAVVVDVAVAVAVVIWVYV